MTFALLSRDKCSLLPCRREKVWKIRVYKNFSNFRFFFRWHTVPAFLHFFNFSCIFLAAFLNLVLAIAQNLNFDFSGLEQQGKAVISIIATNTIINTIISLGVLIFEIYQKCKSVRNSGRSKKENKQKLKVLKIEISSSANKENSPADLSNTTLKPRPRDSRSRRGNVQLTCSEASFPIER